MFKVELYGRVRRAVLVDGLSQRAVARVWDLAQVGPEDGVVFGAARISAGAAGDAAEA